MSSAGLLVLLVFVGMSTLMRTEHAGIQWDETEHIIRKRAYDGFLNFLKKLSCSVNSALQGIPSIEPPACQA
jgi:hypothetical protein